MIQAIYLEERLFEDSCLDLTSIDFIKNIQLFKQNTVKRIYGWDPFWKWWVGGMVGSASLKIDKECSPI